MRVQHVPSVASSNAPNPIFLSVSVDERNRIPWNYSISSPSVSEFGQFEFDRFHFSLQRRPERSTRALSAILHCSSRPPFSLAKFERFP